MAIIKTYAMSTIEEVKNSTRLMRKMQEERKYEEYTRENIMLVRTTNVFPTDRKITTLAESTFISKTTTNFIHSALFCIYLLLVYLI